MKHWSLGKHGALPGLQHNMNLLEEPQEMHINDSLSWITNQR